MLQLLRRRVYFRNVVFNFKTNLCIVIICTWLSQFNASGAFESVDCQIAGLGEVSSIQELYVAHTKAAIDSLNG